MSVLIPLSQNKVAIIDDADAPHVSQYKWYAHESRGKFYAARQVRIGANKQQRVFLHRELMQPPPGMDVDHINGDSLDCRRENMRLSTQAENNRNKGRHRNTRNAYIGVTRHPRCVTAPWQAYINMNGKRTYLGYFATAEDAARARDAKARELHGLFARLNFSDTSDERLLHRDGEDR